MVCFSTFKAPSACHQLPQPMAGASAQTAVLRVRRGSLQLLMSCWQRVTFMASHYMLDFVLPARCVCRTGNLEPCIPALS